MVSEDFHELFNGAPTSCVKCEVQVNSTLKFISAVKMEHDSMEKRITKVEEGIAAMKNEGRGASALNEDQLQVKIETAVEDTSKEIQKK